MKTIGRDFGDTARKVYAVASGALGNGKTCIVNADGTVSVVSQSNITQALGSEATFESAAIQYTCATFDSTNNKVIIGYKDAGNSARATVAVGTISGSDISFGTPVVVNSGWSSAEFFDITYDSAAERVVIVGNDGSNSAHGTAAVGTVNGTSISFGTPVVFNAGSTEDISAVFVPVSNKIVVAYKNGASSNRGERKVGTVSDTSISFGSAQIFDGSTSTTICMTATKDSKVVTVYRDGGSSNRLTAIIGTVSGTSISNGGTAVVTSSNSEPLGIAYDSVNDKVVVAYGESSSSTRGTAVVGTISGTSISFGSAANFNTTTTVSGQNNAGTGVVYDSSAKKIVIFYRNQQTQPYSGVLVVGTVSGDSISFGDLVTFYSGSGVTGPLFVAATFDSNENKCVVAYEADANNDHGKARVFINASTPTNLTSENYIGITPSAYPDGAGAEIQTKGAINEEQSGLTAGQSYFVQTDGTLGTTADDPSVFAGTAVSATKIIVKG